MRGPASGWPPGLVAACVAAVALAGVIVAQVWDDVLSGPAAPAGAAREAPAARPPVGGGETAEDATARYAAALLARPLFSPSRRPDGTDVSGTTPGLGRLSGVMASPAGKVAIFADPGGGKPVVLGEGGRIGGYVVGTIEAGAVTIIGPDGRRTLHPSFDPGPPAKPAPPAAARRPPTAGR